WSVATSASLPSRILPGVWVKVSQIDGERPSSSTAPSIWNADVATPHQNSFGNGLSVIPPRLLLDCTERSGWNWKRSQPLCAILWGSFVDTQAFLLIR